MIGIGDRGLLYGDGLFETIAIREGAPCLWSAHLARLRRGAERLGIPYPGGALLRAEANLLSDGVGQGVLRLTLTRGEGGRGYRPPPHPSPTRILARYPSPERAASGGRLILCRTPLGNNPQLAGIKHLNRLEQVLARAEWQDPGIIDGVMTDVDGQVICGTMTNLFLVLDDGIVTPALNRCGVAGTVRALVFEHAAMLGIPLDERDIAVAELSQARSLFVTNALIGLIPVPRFDARRLDPGAVPCTLVEQIREAVFQPETPE